MPKPIPNPTSPPDPQRFVVGDFSRLPDREHHPDDGEWTETHSRALRRVRRKRAASRRLA